MRAAGILFAEGNKILLGKKGYGNLRNKWSGFGGKLNDGESSLKGSVREVLEEIYGIKTARNNLIDEILSKVFFRVIYKNEEYTLYSADFKDLQHISKIIADSGVSSPFFRDIPQDVYRLTKCRNSRPYNSKKWVEITQIKVFYKDQIVGNSFDPYVIYDLNKLLI